jgi:hypothetical protein
MVIIMVNIGGDLVGGMSSSPWWYTYGNDGGTQVFRSALFSVAKCPSDYVRNVVEIAVCLNSLRFMIAFILVFWCVWKNFVIFGKDYSMSGKILLFLKKIMI